MSKQKMIGKVGGKCICGGKIAVRPVEMFPGVRVGYHVYCENKDCNIVNQLAHL